MRITSGYSLGVMGACALVDRYLLALHGHSSYWWLPVYGIGYAILIALVVRNERVCDLAVHQTADAMKTSWEVFERLQARIRELEGKLADDAESQRT